MSGKKRGAEGRGGQRFERKGDEMRKLVEKKQES